MRFISWALRAIVDAEALNMAESVGNYTRHRRAPMVYRKPSGGFGAVMVPAISGQSIAHAYQALLAAMAEREGLPVCEKCKAGEFIKHSAKEVFGASQWEEKLKSLISGKGGVEALHAAEKLIVENCVVEDVGGFLITEESLPAKRTSKAWFSYALPARAYLDASKLVAQMHVRHAPLTLAQQQERQEESGKAKKKEGGSETKGQAIYYVEMGCGIYAFGGFVDLCAIGCTSLVRRECVSDAEKGNAVKRRELALKALIALLSNQLYGAKKSRSYPFATPISAVFAVSEGVPFTVTPAHEADYIIQTAKRAVKHAAATGSKVHVYYYVNETYEKVPDVPNAERVETLEDLYEKLKPYAVCG